jgi:hypothetical protein
VKTEKMKMAWIASKDGRVYALCSAEPALIEDAAREIKKWRKDGAEIELLPAAEAKDRFCVSLPKPEAEKQLSLFS